MPHQIEDVVEQSIRLSKVAVAEPIEVKVGHRDGVDTFDDGVRLKVASARGVMEIGGQIDCQVAIRCVKRGAIAVLGVQAGQVEKEVSVHVRRSEEDLAKLDRPPRLRISGDALQSTQQAAVPHAVGDDMDLCRSRPGGELHEKIRDRPLAGLDARLVGRISDHVATRGPTEERRRAWHRQVATKLRGANGGVLKAHIEPMQKNQRMRCLVLVHSGLKACVKVGISLNLQSVQSQLVIPEIKTLEFAPETAPGFTEAVRVGHAHGHLAKGRTGVTLAREPLPIGAGAAVRAEPHGIQPLVGSRSFSTALGVGEVNGLDPEFLLLHRVKFRHQGADLALHSGPLGGFNDQPLLDLSNQFKCPLAIATLDGGGEFLDKLGKIQFDSPA